MVSPLLLITLVYSIAIYMMQLAAHKMAAHKTRWAIAGAGKISQDFTIACQMEPEEHEVNIP